MRNDLMRFKLYRPLLIPNIGNVLAYLSICCLKSINWFFWILRRSVSSWFSKKPSLYSLALRFFVKIICPLRTLKIYAAIFWCFFPFQGFFDRIFAFFTSKPKCATNLKRGIVELIVTHNTGFSCKLNEIETEVGSCFSIQNIVSIVLTLRSVRNLTQKLKNRVFFNKVWSRVYSILKPSGFSNNLSPKVETPLG